VAQISKPQQRLPKAKPIHDSVKSRLGYEINQPDKEVLSDWRARLRRVCKPCWELKYCPYGPLVEQSPMLPVARSDVVAHNNYLRKCLQENQIGVLEPLSDERRKTYEDWLRDEDLLTWQAQNELNAERRDAHVAASPEPGAEFEKLFSGEIPSIEQYRVQYSLPDKFDWNGLSLEYTKLLKAKIRKRKKYLVTALKTGIDDTRRPLDEGRRISFTKSLSNFSLENYPEEIPEIFQDGECNIFGHICPVFFAAEAMTETSTERRRGRYIPFAVKMRVVRRDNHTCQHCSKHLADDEVEFDHRIPISKGGSSEEHNIRLTCYDCNRDKSDKIEI
jgi:HNH endonuclease